MDMNESDKEHGKNATLTTWERWGSRVGNYLPYATLAAATAISWLQPGQAPGGHLLNALLALGAAAWAYFLHTRAAEPRLRQPGRMRLYFAGFLVLASVLMLRHPIYFLFTVTGFFHASDLRPWPAALLGVGLTSILVNTLITGFPWPERDSWVFFGVLIVFQTLAIGFGILLGEKLSNLSEERREAVARLEAALEENTGLQAQLVAQAREAGVLEERQRLAREIHDTLAQGLAGIITQLEAARHADGRQAPGEGETALERHLENALRLGRESLAEARRSVHALRPAHLEGAGLPEALEQVARDWEAVNGTPVEVNTTGERQALPPEVEAALLRTAQEALANIARHAGAGRVGLTLTFLGETAALDIVDDGVGFDPQAQTGAGFGLASMRQRLGQVGGWLEIESEPGAGAALSARVPLAASRDEAPEEAGAGARL